MQPDVIHSPSK